MATQLPSSIVMYGPPACGKTTILRALVRSFIFYEQPILEQTGMRVRMELSNQTAVIQGAEDPARPTSTLEADLLKFRRDPPDGKKRNSRHQLSSFAHEIRPFDAPGGWSSPGADRSVSSLEVLMQKYDRAAVLWEALKTSVGIVAILDHTAIEPCDILKPSTASEEDNLEDEEEADDEGSEKLTEDQIVDDDEYISKRCFTRAEYAVMLLRLMWLEPVTQAGFQRKIAICLNKCDQLDARNELGADAIIRANFGNEMEIAIRQLEAHFGPDNIQFFKISAMGYDRDGRTPNYEWRPDLGSYWLKKDKQGRLHWKPENVLKPFMWILEQNERDYLMRTRTIWDRFGGDRLKDYISYYPSNQSL